MKNLIVVFLSVICFNQLFAHNAELNAPPRKWQISNQDVSGYFLMSQANNVYIEREGGKVSKYPIHLFSKGDQQEIAAIQARIATMNREIAAIVSKPINSDVKYMNPKWWLFVFSFFGLSIIWLDTKKNSSKKSYASLVVFVGLASIMYSFTNKTSSTTNPTTMDSAFKPFKPNVYTRWNDSFFFVESKGMPTTHSMMGGITGWQQQVPIPQCYTGSNAWTIPLNPIKAASPVPVNSSHFLRGAIALAVNGVAIFNPYTNTGVDALLDGQLDSFGGHCGRADDYHYHIAPLHLYNYTSVSKPIAYALDGYAVYGSKEPDGSSMLALDANHGHTGSDGVYHYHGTANAPYMIGAMVGKVTEDNTLQIIPQAAASPIRPAGAPLNGAVIKSCVPNSTSNGFTLNYTLNGNNLSWIYSWTPAGDYTFKYIFATGDSTRNYKAKSVCTIPITTDSLNAITYLENDCKILIKDRLLRIHAQESDAINQIEVYHINGKVAIRQNYFSESFDLSNYAKGIYLVRVSFGSNAVVKRIFVE